MRLHLLVVSCVACGRIGFDPSDPLTPPVDGAVASCTTWGPFSIPTEVSELGSPDTDWAPSVSRDGLRMMFSSNRAGTQDLYRTSRPTLASPWAAPSLLGELSTSSDEEDDPSLSDNELELFFGKNELFRMTRSSTSAPFGSVETLVSSAMFSLVQGAELSSDGLRLYFSAGDPISKIYTLTRTSPSDPFGPFEAIPDPDPTGDVGFPTLSADELELIVSVAHGGVRDIFTARRSDRDAAFPSLTVVEEVSSSSEDWDPELSFDGTTLWLASDRMGNGQQLFVAQRACLD